MRDWLWRSLASAATVYGATPWAFVLPDPDQCFVEALLGPSPRRPKIPDTKPRGRWRRRRHQDEIGEECEAFLAGRYYELALGIRGQEVPSWVWINPLAHAPRAELERLARMRTSPHDPMAFLSYLADEVLLGAGESELVFRCIQRDRLVPLELALLGRPASPPDLPALARIVRMQIENTLPLDSSG